GGTSRPVDLISVGNNLWTGSLQATLGTVLRYKYIRRLPTPVEEVTPARQPIPYRLLAITSASANVEDTVAAWADTPFAGDLGGLAGTVRNSNTGQGVMGMIVSAGGKLAVTASDGSYAFFDLPVGIQRVTLLAPDGSLRPTQNSAAVVKGQTTLLDLASTDPNQVNVTFLVSRPVGLETTTPLRIAGNVLQLGNAFIPNAGGSAIAAAREPVLTPLNDDRWTTTVLLYEGTVLNYTYTLSDGLWNGELDVNGAKRLRQLIVPLSNVTIEDSIDAWHGGDSAPVTFDVTTPPNTPANDFITIQFRTDQWYPPLPMWRVGLNAWRFVLYNPIDIQG
ncbi:MAG: carboxypeptidase-like regulatory domain-containing protein, partial [Phycisphaerales bacterium]|nr:carboxypeptidase-like regulatory domain-containing protein [Phycisphaerales bacterium]